MPKPAQRSRRSFGEQEKINGLALAEKIGPKRAAEQLGFKVGNVTNWRKVPALVKAAKALNTRDARAVDRAASAAEALNGHANGHHATGVVDVEDFEPRSDAPTHATRTMLDRTLQSHEALKQENEELRREVRRQNAIIDRLLGVS